MPFWAAAASAIRSIGTVAARVGSGAKAVYNSQGMKNFGRAVYGTPQKRAFGLKTGGKAGIFGGGEGSGFLHHAGNVGQALWALDQASARFAANFSQYTETITIRVYGQRWARIVDLYTLSLCLLTSSSITLRQRFSGGEGLNVVIDRTGKYVELEFQRNLRGMDTIHSGGGRRLFDDPYWLTNELRVPISVSSLQDYLPTVLYQSQYGTQAAADAIGNREPARLTNPDPTSAVSGRQFNAWLVAQATLAAPGMVLVTHEKATNPAPIFDGRSMGTDLTAMFTQHLHSPLDYPPHPDGVLGQTYEVQAAPRGPWAANGRSTATMGVGFGAHAFNWARWWEGDGDNKYRWFAGWVGGTRQVVRFLWGAVTGAYYLTNPIPLASTKNPTPF